jgi:hypothetical protein
MRKRIVVGPQPRGFRVAVCAGLLLWTVVAPVEAAGWFVLSWARS